MSASTLPEVLAHPVARAREHAAAGGRVVGYVGDHIPVELILAAEALPLRLYASPHLETPHADAFLESAFTPLTRHIAQDWLTGALDFLDAVIFPRDDDSAQRLYYYLCELQRRGAVKGPKPLIFDLALIERDTSREHSRASVRLLASQLRSNADRLASAAEQVERRRALLARLADMMKQDETPAGSAVLELIRASNQAWSDEADAALPQSIEALPRTRHTRRVMLVGSEPLDARLHLAIEGAGGCVVSCASSHDRAVAHGSVPLSLDAIADLYCVQARGAGRLASGIELARRARELRVDGVIFWLIEQDEGIVWRLPQQVAALQSACVPLLQLTRQCPRPEEPTLREIHDFVSTLGVAR